MATRGHRECGTTFSRHAVALLLALIPTGVVSAQTSGWNAPRGGDWLLESNWNSGVPNSIGASAVFGPSFPTSSTASIQVSSPVTLGSLTQSNPSRLTIRDQLMTFDNGGLGSGIFVDSGAGQLTIASPLLITDRLSIQVDHSAGPLVLGGALVGTGDVDISLAGMVDFDTNNSGWSGALQILDANVVAKHPMALGTPEVGTTVHAGSLQLDTGNAEPIDVRGGVVTVRSSVGAVGLNGGAVRMARDRPVTFLTSDSRGGEIQLGVPQWTSPIVLPTVATPDDSFTLLGFGETHPPFVGRTILGSVAFAGSSQNNVLGLGARNEFLTVETPLLQANHIHGLRITEGFVMLDVDNDFAGPTIVENGATLQARAARALGSSSGTEADATIVRSGGRLDIGHPDVSASELIILEGGQYAGDGTRDIVIRDRGIVGTSNNFGSITGTGELVFNDGHLVAPLAFTGQVLIASHAGSVVTVSESRSLGDANRPVVVVDGDLNLKTTITSPLHVDGGRVRLNMPEFGGQFLLRGGALVSDEQTVHLTAPIEYTGNGSAFESLNHMTQMFLDAPITGDGDLRLGRNVVLNHPIEVGGDLVIAGGQVEIHSAPRLGGQLIIGGLWPYEQLRGSTIIRADMSIPVLLRNGALEAADGVTLSSTRPVIEIHAGYVGARLGNVETILKTRPGDLTLRDIGSTDAEIVIQQGRVDVEIATGFGGTGGGVIVDAPAGAALTLTGTMQTYTDSIDLRNATGIGRQGGLVLGGSENRLTGDLHLGDKGSIVGLATRAVEDEFTIDGEVHGGDLFLIGAGTLRFETDRLKHLGQTVVGRDWGNTILSLAGTARLAESSSVVLRDRGTLILDKRQQSAATDQLADHVPLEMRSGTLQLVTSGAVDPSETVGTINLAAGSSQISLSGDANNPPRLTIAELKREPGAVVRFHHDMFSGGLGGNGPSDSQVTLHDPEFPVGSFLGPWALAGSNRPDDRFDFAVFGERGITAMSELGRPGELNGAQPDDHVRLTAPPFSMASDTTIGTLVTQASMDIDLGSHTLNVAEGGLLVARGGLRMLNGKITRSADPGEEAALIIHTQSDETEIHADIVDTASSTVSLVKSGSNRLLLFGRNTYQGGTLINEGDVFIHDAAALPAGSDVTLVGGGLLNESNEIVRIGHLEVQSGLASRVDAETITMTSGRLHQPYGTGVVQKVGPDRASLADTRQYRGSVDVISGTLAMEAIQMGNFDMAVRDTGTLRFDPYSGGSVPGRILLDNGELSSHAGTIFVPVTLEKTLTVRGDSRVEVGPLNRLLLADGLNLESHATLTKQGPGILDIGGQALVGQDTVLSMDLGTLRLNAGLFASDESSSLRLTTARSDLLDDEIEVTIGGDNRFYDGDLFISSIAVSVEHPFALGAGTTTVEQGSQLILRVPQVHGSVFLDGGQLVTTNSHQFVGNLINAGDIQPGASPGTLQVDGNYTQQSSARLAMEIASPLLSEFHYPQQNDLLDVSGTLSLDGTLSVSLLHDYAPGPGDHFELLKFGQLVGRFSQIDLPPLPDNRAWSLASLYTAGELAVVAHVIGDSNRDGLFNSSDLVRVFQAGRFETGQAASWAEGDWNFDHVFDSADLVAAFQGGTYTAGVGSAVPEPSGMVTVLLVGLVTVLGPARRWSKR